MLIFILVIGPDMVWEAWGLVMRGVQLSNGNEHIRCQAVMELAVQDSVNCTAMHCVCC